MGFHHSSSSGEFWLAPIVDCVMIYPLLCCNNKLARFLRSRKSGLFISRENFMHLLYPGDRVAFHEDFTHGGQRWAAAMGVVKAVRGDRAEIEWDLDGLPRVVNITNLRMIGERRS
jgi:hypothetical protein